MVKSELKSSRVRVVISANTPCAGKGRGGGGRASGSTDCAGIGTRGAISRAGWRARAARRERAAGREARTLKGPPVRPGWMVFSRRATLRAAGRWRPAVERRAGAPPGRSETCSLAAPTARRHSGAPGQAQEAQHVEEAQLVELDVPQDHRQLDEGGHHRHAVQHKAVAQVEARRRQAVCGAGVGRRTHAGEWQPSRGHRRRGGRACLSRGPGPQAGR